MKDATVSKSSSETAATTRPQLRSARFVTMFIVLCVLFSIGQFHRSSGAVLSPVFVEDLFLNAEQIGLVIGGMFIAQGFMQLPSGVLIDRYGTRIVLPTMVLLAVVGSFLIAFAEGWLGVLVGRALLGAGFATSLLGAYVVFVRWGDSEIIATLTGRYLFVGGIGALCATYPLARLLEVFDWRTVFAGFGVGTLILAAVTYVAVRDAPDETSHKPAMGGEGKTLMGSILGLGVVLRDRRLWPVLSIALFMYSPLQVLIGLWAGPFMKDVHDIDAIDRSYILLVMAVAMSTGMLIYGPIERFFNARRPVVLAATSAIAAMFGALAVAGYASLWVSATLFILITVTAPYFVVVLAHSQVMFDSNYASRVVSLINLLAISGIFVMQYVTGHVIGAVTDDPDVTGSVLGYRLVFGLMAAIYVVVTLVYSRTRDIPPRG